MGRNTSKRRVVIGYIAGIINSICYGFGTASAQGLLGVVPDGQLSVYRYLAHLLVFLPLAKLTGTGLKVEQQFIPYVLCSALLTLTFSIGIFGSAGYIPLLEAVGIAYVVAICAVAIHGRIVFKEDITLLHMISLALCIVGVINLCQPSWLYPKQIPHVNNINSSSHPSNTTSYAQVQSPEMVNNHTVNHVSGVVLYGLLIFGSFADGINYNINAVYLLDVPPLLTALYGSLVGLVGSLVMSLYLENIVIYLNWRQVFLVLGHVSCSPIVFFTTVYTSNAIGGVRASLLFSLQIIMMLVLQYTLMSTIMPGHRNRMEVFGAGVLLFAVTLYPTYDLVRSYHKADTLP